MQGTIDPSATSDLAIIVPCYQDDEALCTFLDLHGALFADIPLALVRGQDSDVSIDDSEEGEPAVLRGNKLHTIRYSIPGRGQQIAAGIASIAARWYWILHVDSQISEHTLAAVIAVTRRADSGWGRCSVQLPGVALVARLMNVRSKLTQICTGDQGMFIAGPTLQAAGGFPQLPLMEDIEVSRQLKRQSAAFYPLNEPIVGSARRWQQRGVIRTVLSMWWYRLRYFFGASAHQLHRDYYAR